MKAIFTYLCILLGLTALVISTSVKLSECIHRSRTTPLHKASWLGEPVAKWGDLTAMSYLEMVPHFCEPRAYDFRAPAKGAGDDNVNLYLYGDSYIKDIPKTAFAKINGFHFIPRIGSYDICLEHGKRKILILEVAERYLRGRFKDTGVTNCIRVVRTQAEEKSIAPTDHKASTTSYGIKDLFNPNINQNLEYHLFNYCFLLAPRQIKAAINYTLFNRASGDVVISENGKYLFFKPTVGGSVLSSYCPLKRDEVNKIVNSLNAIYAHFKRSGFDEIYFSVIPNTASILQPGYYNQAIPLVQNDPNLKNAVYRCL